MTSSQGDSSCNQAGIGKRAKTGVGFGIVGAPYAHLAVEGPPPSKEVAEIVNLQALPTIRTVLH